MRISPKRSPKSILEEGQTSKECHVKQAVPDSKGRASHATKPGETDRKVARAARATSAVVQPDFKYQVFVLLGGGVSFS